MEKSEWTKYSSVPVKMFYDIELFSGDVIYNCYPNANTFHTPNGQVIEDKHVRNFKLSNSNWEEI